MKKNIEKLSKIKEKIGKLSKSCPECLLLSKEVENLLGKDNFSKDDKKQYRKILKHLNSKHRIFEEGQLLAYGVALGPAIGVAFGSAFSNPGAGIGVGIGIGAALGAAFEKKAKDEERII